MHKDNLDQSYTGKYKLKWYKNDRASYIYIKVQCILVKNNII
mgnify:CR=1 FL=1